MGVNKISGGPIIWRIRNFLSGRNLKVSHRYEYDQAARTQPDVTLPPGIKHNLSANYYGVDDARRSVAPPDVVTPAPLQITEGSAEESEVKRKVLTPGDNYRNM